MAPLGFPRGPLLRSPIRPGRRARLIPDVFMAPTWRSVPIFSTPEFASTRLSVPKARIIRWEAKASCCSGCAGRDTKPGMFKTAVVEHCIRDYQLEQSWVLKRAIRFGRGQFYLFRETIPCWFGLPFRVIPRIFQRWLRIAKARTRFSEHELFTARWELNCLMGQVIEARQLYRAQQGRK